LTNNTLNPIALTRGRLSPPTLNSIKDWSKKYKMELIELIKEPTFWIISAIGSVLLSVVANLVTPYAGRLVGKLFASRKSKIEKKKQALINEVRYVSSDQNNILNYKVDAAYWLLRGIMLLALGTILFSVASYIPIIEVVPLIIAAIFIARSAQWLDEAKNKYKIAQLAMKRVEEERRITYEWNREQYGDAVNDPLQEELSKWDLANIN